MFAFSTKPFWVSRIAPRKRCSRFFETAPLPSKGGAFFSGRPMDDGFPPHVIAFMRRKRPTEQQQPAQEPPSWAAASGAACQLRLNFALQPARVVFDALLEKHYES